jgi:serine/threonine-protein kinase
MSSTKPNASLPTDFGRYQIRRLLGRGGMASVYLATDTALDREVALKVPDQELINNPRFVELFQYEARTTARLNHEHICRIWDRGEIMGIPYMSLEYVVGTNLKDYIPPSGRWDPSDAASLVHTIALALAKAHALAIIHRDLKPHNILLAMSGSGEIQRPVITDFGLALILNQAKAPMPRPGNLVGTLAYMPPEQVHIGKAPLGPGCDIYSLGVILYQLLTGRLPFPGPGQEQLIRQILNQEPPRPSGLRTGIFPALEAVCLRALAKNVRDRFATMEEFAEALARAMTSAALVPAAEAPESVPARPLVPREAIRFAFAGYGAQPPAVLRDHLWLDVGSALRPGAIDHHHIVASAGSNTRFVLSRPDLIDAAVTPDRAPHEPFRVVVHKFPDLDAVASAFLAAHYLATGEFPPGADHLAAYVDLVDQGTLKLTQANPLSLYAAYQRLANRPAADPAADATELWRLNMEGGIRLVGYVLDRAVQTNTSVQRVDAFECPGLFGPADSQAVLDDLRRYEEKLANPACHARVALLRLPGQFGGTEEMEALLVRDVQNEDDPDRCLFFSEWARTDARHSSDGRGFVALSVYMSEGNRQWRSCILSVTPGSRASLRGLGELLDEAEGERRREINGGVDDRVVDPHTGASKAPRPGYKNADPWYDGRAHQYTIVDAPNSGTRLTAERIEELFLQYGGCTTPPRPI